MKSLTLRRILIGDNESVLVIRNRRFAKILAPGERWMFTLGRGIGLERHNVRELAYSGEWADYIANSQPEMAARFFTLVETSDVQVAVVYLDGRLGRVIGPSNRVLFWKGPANVTFEQIDVRAHPEVPQLLLAPLARLGRESAVTFASVDEGKRGLAYLGGRLFRELGPGNYGFWNVVSTPRVEMLEIRRQAIEVTGQEILTTDKVTVHVNISAAYEIVNVTNARAGAKDVAEYLYSALQIAVRQSLGNRTLEQVLAEKTDIDEAVSADVRRRWKRMAFA